MCCNPGRIIRDHPDGGVAHPKLPSQNDFRDARHSDKVSPKLLKHPNLSRGFKTWTFCTNITCPILYRKPKLLCSLHNNLLPLLVRPVKKCCCEFLWHKWTQIFNSLSDSNPFHRNLGFASDSQHNSSCLLYTSDAADDLLCVDLGG